jgi:hypothetical protein
LLLLLLPFCCSSGFAVASREQPVLSATMCRGDRGGPLLQQAPKGQPLLLGLNAWHVPKGCVAGAAAPSGFSANLTDPRLQPWICHFTSEVWRQYVTRECPVSDTGLVTPGTAVHQDPPPMPVVVTPILTNHSQGQAAASAARHGGSGGGSSSDAGTGGAGAPALGGTQTSSASGSKDVRATLLLWVAVGSWLLGLLR